MGDKGLASTSVFWRKDYISHCKKNRVLGIITWDLGVEQFLWVWLKERRAKREQKGN
jgi:hypothetical protein